MCYIPDMTERFPEGMDGIDMTDYYFPDQALVERIQWEEWERSEGEMED